MDSIQEKTIELKELIEKEPLVQEYRRVESLYRNNEEVKQILKDIDKAIKNKDETKRKELIERFNSHPLVTNYMNLKEEVHEFLKEISNSLNI